MVFANEYGFLPARDGAENAAALQKILSVGGDIRVEQPGIYDVSDTVILESHTHLSFGPGVILRRQPDTKENAALMINRGAYTGGYDEDISVDGLRLICNGVFCDAVTPDSRKGIVGLSAQLAFFRVRNMQVRNFATHDLPAHSFAVQICDFENIVVENVWIEGLKDGVHLGKGKGFVIRHGFFRTFDDPIALNAHDYATSNPVLGWIEDGLIEDCYDLDDDTTTGFFCRILAGSWLEWRKGMKIQNSDTVLSGGRLYRALMPPDGREYISEYRPEHPAGTVTEPDGIRWCMTQRDDILNCGCRNITFRDIYLEKKRPVGIAVHFDGDKWSRSYYPNSPAPVQDHLVFERVYSRNDIPTFLYTKTPLKHMTLRDCDFGNGVIRYRDAQIDGLTYGSAELNMENCHSALPDGELLVIAPAWQLKINNV